MSLFNKIFKGQEKDKKHDCELVYAPITGEYVSLEKIPDPVFSSGVLGDGCGIIPHRGEVTSPVDGKVMIVSDTKHSVSIEAHDGRQFLIHIGIDTVKLNGEHFNAHVKPGDKVKAGDLLVEFDIEKIKEAGYPTVTPIIVTNTDSYSDVEVVVKGKVKEKDKLVSVR